MIDLLKCSIETMWDDGTFVLLRAVQHQGRSDILVRRPSVVAFSPLVASQLEHSFALRDELESAWAARPLEIVVYLGEPALLMENPGGTLLASLLGAPWNLRRFLRVAIGVAVSLGCLHERGIVHKDVKPTNILVDQDTGKAWLMGFGIASRLVRERQAKEPPSVIAGTLPYMAPEQTGRMNRSIDSRSDLYSFGITLYQMLTGELPFTASDPLEWIHCHVARLPIPASERAPSVPAAVSLIISKLMSKNAEERYQTASGVEADLRKCLGEWETYGRIEPFPLGTRDVPDKLLIPEKIYGRDREIEALRMAFDSVQKSGKPRAVFVSGYSGIGKSSIVAELQKTLGGFFASGKFDQYRRNIPYACLSEAFRSLVLSILSSSDATLARWRTVLQGALGANGQLIADLVPEIELVIGKYSHVPDLPLKDAQHRFRMVIRQFLCAFAQAEHPLILFLDDLQWLDAGTLELLQHLLVEQEVQHLLFVGSYRSNEVDTSHPMVRMLAELREAHVMMDEIFLAPLRPGEVVQLIADALRCEREQAEPLAILVNEKTGGNPFFVNQFLGTLAEERLIVFNTTMRKWVWDLEAIRIERYTDNVTDLMIGKVIRLPEETQQILKTLAVLGNTAQAAMLGMASGISKNTVHRAIWDALKAGIIFRQGDVYGFLHDRIQEATYALIPEGERAAIHLRIGRILAEHTLADKSEVDVFEIVNQLNRGIGLVTSAQEREQIAAFNLTAARKAKGATAYESSLSYLSTAKELLADNCWEQNYHLAFAIELTLAECELFTGKTTHANQRLTALSKLAKTITDAAAVTCLRQTLYTTQDQSDRAVEVCLEYLELLGTHWSQYPTRDEVQEEYDELWRRLGSRSIEELADLPLMSNPESRATLDVLTEVVTPVLFTNESLLSRVVCRMVNISLEYGNCDGSCFAYIWMGMILGPRFGDYQAGFRFGKLGIDLVEKHNLYRFQARVYGSFGTLIVPWTKHIKTGRDFLRRAFEAANRHGDLTFAAYSCNNLITNLLASGDPLESVLSEAEEGLGFARKMQFGLIIDIITEQIGLIRVLRGLTPSLASFNDDHFDESKFECRLRSDPRSALAECWYWIRKLQARFFAMEYSSAVEASSKAQTLLWTSPSFFEVAEYHFYSALAHAACCDATGDVEHSRHFKELLEHYTQLDLWAQNCPENFTNRAALVAAEVARVEGRACDAMSLYEKAIESAHAQGFVQNEGVANELAARFYAQRSFVTISHIYLQKARECYLRWGADGKVRQLDQLYPDLRNEKAVRAPLSLIEAPVAQLDLVTVVKVSQAVSGELVHEKLIQTLMTIAIEHAGADRALFIVPRGSEEWIEAEATTGRNAVAVQLLGKSSTPSELPESMLKYVIRTQEGVILDDALAPNPFSTDDYIAEKKVRSILCLPLVKHSVVVGVLYLENITASHVFTAPRAEVLKLLASQAVISLDNTRLYADLQKSEDHLRLAINTIPAIVWSSLPNGTLDFFSRRWEEFTGLPARDGFGDGWMKTIHPDDLPGLVAVFRESLETGKPFTYEARKRRADGHYRYVLTRALPLCDESGEIVRWYGVCTDIEDHRRAEESLQTAFEEIKELKDALYRENVVLKEEIEQASLFDGIVGSSVALQSVLTRVAKVAPTDSTVLITGETGTGKEMIARAIHKASHRSDRAFVSVNCAAIPTPLIASELFGHEKGAFTGAHQRRLGRFELADGGTIFLDEVGELPAETQISLLRVLQEREFERIGGSRRIAANIRLIAATNRNLQAAVADGLFRSDLFYRLDVFPIEMPPLRERKEDIPMLVEHFLNRFGRRTGKRFRRINQKTLAQLKAYHWPGNIRELQNVIERSLIVCESDEFSVDERWLRPSDTLTEPSSLPTSRMAPDKLHEREMIEAALAEAGGRVSGPSGAAAKLNMPASTLDYKIRMLKIDKFRFKDR